MDESDVRVRPSPGSRPRTKTRPRHREAVPGRVITVDRGRYTCLLDPLDVLDPTVDPLPHNGSADESPVEPVTVIAVTARELGRGGVVVGDRVGLVGDTSGRTDSLARIVRIDERRTVLRRTADDDDPVERVVVANADQLVVVVAITDPPPRSGLIDRALVAAYDAGLDPLLCLTKTDLADPAEFLATYAPLNVPHLTTRRSADTADPAETVIGVEALRERVHGRTSVMLGHSGVGKSTLVNALVPGTGRHIGVVNAVTGRGRHTSTSAIALRLPDGGWVVDTPGIRSFGLAHVDADRLVGSFPDLAPGVESCPRGCQHDEPGECGLDAFVASGGAGTAGEARLASLRRLLGARGRI